MPRLKLLYRAVRATLPDWLRSRLDAQPNPFPIVSRDFAEKAKRLRKLIKCYSYGQERLPSRKDKIRTWEHLLVGMEGELPLLVGCHERTFPYFDRDLLEFLHSIPRTQLIRVGQRRSLMRRALTPLIPHDVLWRKNKAVSERVFMRIIEDESLTIKGLLVNAQADALGYLNAKYIRKTLEAIYVGQPDCLPASRKFIALELWLRYFEKRCIKPMREEPSYLSSQDTTASEKMEHRIKEFLFTETE